MPALPRRRGMTYCVPTLCCSASFRYACHELVTQPSIPVHQHRVTVVTGVIGEVVPPPALATRPKIPELRHPPSLRYRATPRDLRPPPARRPATLLAFLDCVRVGSTVHVLQHDHGAVSRIQSQQAAYSRDTAPLAVRPAEASATTEHPLQGRRAATPKAPLGERHRARAPAQAAKLAAGRSSASRTARHRHERDAIPATEAPRPTPRARRMACSTSLRTASGSVRSDHTSRTTS